MGACCELDARSPTDTPEYWNNTELCFIMDRKVGLVLLSAVLRLRNCAYLSFLSVSLKHLFDVPSKRSCCSTLSDVMIKIGTLLRCYFPTVSTILKKIVPTTIMHSFVIQVGIFISSFLTF